jgi:hypothetical protein
MAQVILSAYYGVANLDKFHDFPTTSSVLCAVKRLESAARPALRAG